MKIVLLSIVATLLISGCATRNAFSKLDIEIEQERAIENTRCAKIISENNVGGIFSAIYLNNIYKDIGQKVKLFYISIYVKDGIEDLNITLNKEQALSIEKLSKNNDYSKLLSTQNEWTQNYVVAFSSTQSPDIKLSIDSGRFSSGPLEYSEDLQ